MIEALKKQQEKLKDILATVVNYEGDAEKCKQVSKKKKESSPFYIVFFLKKNLFLL